MPLTDAIRRQAAQALAQKAVGSSAPAASAPAAEAPPAKTGLFAKKPAAPAHNGPDPKAHLVALLDGFASLLVSAVDDKGRTLETVKFDDAVDASGRHLLERVRHVFIEAQSNREDRQKAAAAWPALEAELHKATAAARKAGVAAAEVDRAEDNIANAADGYIHVHRKGPLQIETVEGYNELLNGLADLVDVVYGDDLGERRGIGQDADEAKQRAALTAVKFGTHLPQRHRDLLERLRHIFVLANTPGHGHEAVADWDAWFGDVNYVFKRMGELDDVDKPTRKRREDLIAALNRAHQGLVLASAYQESHEKAVAKVEMPDADAPRDLERLRRSVEALEKADALRKKGEELSSQSVLELMAGSDEEHAELIGQVFELIHGGVEIDHLWEELKKKKGLKKWITVGELADKITSAASTLEKFTFTFLETHAKEQAAKFLAEGAEDLVKHWEGVEKWATDWAEKLKVVGTVALVVTVAVSAIKVVELIKEGKIEEAVKEGASTAIGIGAGMAAGAAGTAMFAGIAFGIEAEWEGLKGAAAMIEYCREENRKDAIGSFYNVIDQFKGEAKDFPADLKLLADPKEREVWPKAQANLASYAEWWGVCLKRLNGQMDPDRKSVIGGQPEFLKALGPETVNCLRSGVPASTYEGIAEQVLTVLKGANALSAHLAAEMKAEDDKKRKEEERKAAEDADD
ncbi:MAG TPA: hypothetical protein VFH70_09575 [Acidimicrobiales bacterium]|nr:hypothetical protein [Acidimicrobiales bacterium]